MIAVQPEAGPSEALGSATLPPAAELDRLAEGPWVDDLRATQFAPALEARFRRDTAPARQRLMARRGVLGLLFYTCMLIPDSIMVPDRLHAALFWRLAVFLPLSLWLLCTLNRGRKRQGAEWLSAGMGTLAALVSLVIMLPSQAPWATTYLVLLTANVVYADAVLRLRLRPALAMCAVHVLAYAYGLAVMPFPGWPLALSMTLLLLSTVVFSLHGSRTQEQAERQAYLLALRRRLLRIQLRQAHQQLQRQTRLDPLTQIGNRFQFDEAWLHAFTQAQMHGTALALVLFDIDHFKAYNDRHGHPEGDRCLRTVAQAANACTRNDGDVLARYGGEEFALVLPGASPEEALAVAERVRAAIQACQLPHAGSGTAPVVTASVGLCCTRPGPDDTAAGLLQRADQALYRAKSQGRNRVLAWSEVPA